MHKIAFVSVSRSSIALSVMVILLALRLGLSLHHSCERHASPALTVPGPGESIDEWQLRCGARLEAVRQAISLGALGVSCGATIDKFDGPGGPGVVLRVGGHRFVAGASGSFQDGVVDHDWYDLNHGFAPAASTLPASTSERVVSLFKDANGRSAFIASLDEDGPRRLRFVELVKPAVDDCLKGPSSR